MFNILPFRQLFQFAIIGISNNFLGYLIYLFLTLWIDPKLAITILYPLGAITSYFPHSKYSFTCSTRKIQEILRYTLVYTLCYCLNIFLLFIFTDKLHFSHQIIQALTIGIVGVVLFLMLKYFVFPQNKNLTTRIANETMSHL